MPARGGEANLSRSVVAGVLETAAGTSRANNSSTRPPPLLQLLLSIIIIIIILGTRYSPMCVQDEAVHYPYTLNNDVLWSMDSAQKKKRFKLPVDINSSVL